MLYIAYLKRFINHSIEFFIWLFRLVNPSITLGLTLIALGVWFAAFGGNYSTILSNAVGQYTNSIVSISFIVVGLWTYKTEALGAMLVASIVLTLYSISYLVDLSNGTVGERAIRAFILTISLPLLASSAVVAHYDKQLAISRIERLLDARTNNN